MNSAAIDLLTGLGAGEIEHPGGTLLAHLRRVSSLLGTWGADTTVRTAGLCHACYGTDGFGTALLGLSRRAELTAVTAGEAERLVYLYASCDRSATYPTLHDPRAPFRDRFTGTEVVPPVSLRRDFVEITVANELDLVRVDPGFRAEYGPALLELFTRLRPLMSDPAWQACRAELER